MHESAFFQEVEKEAALGQARKLILQILQDRFGPEAVQEFEPPINQRDKMDQLNELHRLAFRCRRLSQFRKAFLKE